MSWRRYYANHLRHRGRRETERVCVAVHPDSDFLSFVLLRRIIFWKWLIRTDQHGHRNICITFMVRGGGFYFKAFHRTVIAAGPPVLLKILERIARRRLPQLIGLLHVARGERA